MKVVRTIVETGKIVLLVIIAVVFAQFVSAIEEFQFNNRTDEQIVKEVTEKLGGKTKKILSTIANRPDQFDYELDSERKYMRILKYKGTDLEVRVPNVIEGYPVLEIASDAFRDNVYLSDVYVPDGVLYIGENVFNGCSSLQAVYIPSTVVSIGDGAFYGCTSLTSIEKAEAKEDYEYYGLQRIGSDAFAECVNLNTVNFPGDTFKKVSLGGRAFANCQNLQNLALPENIVEIGDECFENCVSLQAFKFDKNLVRIGNGAFRGCTALGAVEIPGSIKEVASEAFSGCNSLGILTFGEYVKEEKESQDNYFYALIAKMQKEKEEDYEGSVIANGAFLGTAVENVVVPGYFSFIGYDAFAECKRLQTFRWEDTGRGLAEQRMEGGVFKESTVSSVFLPATVSELSDEIQLDAAFTVYTPEGSFAYNFCKEREIPVEIGQ